MSPGDVSDPIRMEDGWHIMRLVDTKPAAPRPLAEVKDTIVSALRQRKQQENEQAYISTNCSSKTPISVNEIGLHSDLRQHQQREVTGDCAAVRFTFY